MRDYLFEYQFDRKKLKIALYFHASLNTKIQNWNHNCKYFRHVIGDFLKTYPHQIETFKMKYLFRFFEHCFNTMPPKNFVETKERIRMNVQTHLIEATIRVLTFKTLEFKAIKTRFNFFFVFTMWRYSQSDFQEYSNPICFVWF